MMKRLAGLTQTMLLTGEAGAVETLVTEPEQVHGIALVCHPHPLFGGTYTNKVVHTVAKTLALQGYAVMCPNFRGVGGSEGIHDYGEGETRDMLEILRWARQRWGCLPLCLSGFSFGAYVQIRVANHLVQQQTPASRLILLGTATGAAADGSRFYVTEPLPPADIRLLIHGSDDDVVPLQNVFDWAAPQSLPITVIPGTGHFFHGKLMVIRDVICSVCPPLVK